MTAPILVTGGTGTLGRHVVARLRDAGRDLRVLTRQGRGSRHGVKYVTGDLRKNEGVDAAVEGADIILHCAGGPKGDDEATHNLVRAAAKHGAPHLVYISVVGADRIPIAGRIDRTMFGYFGAKHAAERIVAESALPWTILRATQFHDLLLTVAQQMEKLPLIPYFSGFRFQPIEADEVAERLVTLALGTPAGQVPDMGGPKIYAMAELLRLYLAMRGKWRPMLPLRIPGKAAGAFRAGANLVPARAVGQRTWEDFLGERAGGAANERVSATPTPARRASESTR